MRLTQRSLRILRPFRLVQLPRLTCIDITIEDRRVSEVVADLEAFLQTRAEVIISDFRLRGLRSDTVQFARLLPLLVRLRNLLIHGVIDSALIEGLTANVGHSQAQHLQVIRILYYDTLDEIVPGLIGFLQRKAALGGDPVLERLEFQPARNEIIRRGPFLRYSSLQALRPFVCDVHTSSPSGIKIWFPDDFAELLIGFVVAVICSCMCLFRGNSTVTIMWRNMWVDATLARLTAILTDRPHPWFWLHRCFMNLDELLNDRKIMPVMTSMFQASKIYTELAVFLLVQSLWPMDDLIVIMWAEFMIRLSVLARLLYVSV
ncbi:hypothetical protein AURDEDRAFT_177453 [Auricularia subglabra TFB-10046 SS5]|uniref:Uncharacterized protein n=1 Tax=Auricularia subglabra (strain TFB-10046 / SS5) TaxID=717982 RepID=J0LAN5_AURST|nr:hypothetical protein AURDEDRAFT_177453 [Auricularia subglabra TFB-10046 SS5]